MWGSEELTLSNIRKYLIVFEIFWNISKGIHRSSRSGVFCKKGVTCNFIKKETLAQVFSCEFCEIFKNTFFDRTPLVAASEYILLHTRDIQAQLLVLMWIVAINWLTFSRNKLMSKKLKEQLHERVPSLWFHYLQGLWFPRRGRLWCWSVIKKVSQ